MGISFNCPVFASLLALLSNILYFIDVVSDLYTIVSLCQEGNHVSMGILIALLLGSSILVHMFSWIWYSDPNKNLESSVETFVGNYGLIGPLHIFQLGMLLRVAGATEINVRNLLRKGRFRKGEVVCRNHELSMLRLFETFFESAPQVILKMSIAVRKRDLPPFTGITIAHSLVFISFDVFFNQDVRAVNLVDRKRRLSSVVFFLWNLFLIASRMVAVGLFASVLPCYIAVHFLLLWMLLFLWAWRQKTDLMETKGGDLLYRATLAVIWYFSWFSGTRVTTKAVISVYNVCMLLDTALLLGLWFWRRSVESARLNSPLVNPYVLIGALAAVYFTGFLLKLLYYWKFHPKLPRFRFDDGGERPGMPLQRRPAALDDLGEDEPWLPETEPQQTITGAEKRMRTMVMNFYC
ncbi:XK-related protein 8-like [Salminus brasiliensis]|uniref:XK-related protein 8-like n=1 Tax=Salminus brasiliensis TaxID=930266 RepID=UPI003B83415F